MILELSDNAVDVLLTVINQSSVALNSPDVALIGAGVAEFRHAVDAAREGSAPVPVDVTANGTQPQG